MSVDADSLKANASISFAQTRSNSPFASAKQSSDSVKFSASLSAATYQQVLVAQYPIAAAGTQTIDLSSFTTLLYESVTTANKVIGLIFKATGSTGQLKVEPGASNPATWFFGGTTPSITLNCGTGGCCLFLVDGSAYTVDATRKTLKLSNPGAATITVDVCLVVGTP